MKIKIRIRMRMRMRMRIILIGLILLNTTFAQDYTLFGIVTDKNSGETMVGVNIMVIGINAGTYTNNYGFYSISLSHGEYQIAYSFLGFKTDTIRVYLTQNKTTNIQLQHEVAQLNEVTITAKSSMVSEMNMNKNSLNITDIKSIPSFLGEPDLIKSLQLLPGIQTTNEGTTNISIRGGTYDQNLFLLDEAPVYNPDHSLSFFSAFNPDAIKNVTVYKGSYPAQYGGRVSSVIDIRLKEGNTEKYAVSGSLGCIASGLTIEGPLKPDKISFIVSGRYCYAGTVANGIDKLSDAIYIPALNNFPDKNKISFYDLTVKVNHIINQKNRIYLSAYSGADQFFFRLLSKNSSLDWGNNTLTFRWNHVHNTKLFSNQSLIYSNYGYSYFLLDDQRKFAWTSNLKETDYKVDFDWFADIKNYIKFGLVISYHLFQPGKIEKRDSGSVIKSFTLGNQRAIAASYYVSNRQTLTDNLKIEYGIRYNTFFNIGKGTVFQYDTDMQNIVDTMEYKKGEIIKFYNGLEPRFSVVYSLNDKNSLKFSYSRTKQYLHLICNSSVGMPTDVWLPANKYLKPLVSDQVSLGYFNSILKNRLETSVELYYREIQKVIDFKDNSDLFLNNQIETQILPGIRNAYGIEFMVQKSTGKLTGWISYTLSKAAQKIKGVNNDQWYHPTFDKLHNFSFISNYQISQNWNISTTFKYSSGGYATVPKEAFYFNMVPFVHYTERNSYKLPDYHRLDISVGYKSRKNEQRAWKSEWGFGAYNVYNRKNIFSLFTDLDSDFHIKTSKLYLFGIVPFINYSFNF